MAAINEVITKDERVKREIKKLRAGYRKIDKNKLKIVDKLIERAAFLAVSLEDLEKEINEYGYTAEYQNGENQRGTKRSAAVDIHLSMTKNYALIIRQLTEFTPTAPKAKSILQGLKGED